MHPSPVPADPGQVVPSLATGARPCVGVLFVHGAGDHGVGSTLIEFGEPLVSWLDGWLSKGNSAPTSSGDAARAGGAQILVREADSHAPAHSMVALRSERDGPHVWLLAEARWDEAFTPPAFKQVLLWAIGVVPWTVLTQFIGPLLDESRLLGRNLGLILRFFWNVAVSTLLALVVSVILQVVALAILLLSIIPLDPVRDLVSKLQRFASSSVGDLYMVLTSPIQRAALTSAVQRDIDWLRAQGCERIAVLAHSQGGYVAYQALADPWYRPVDTFITFGSGLIRLTESDLARRSGMLRWALVGVVGALVAIRFAPAAILGELEIQEKQSASALAFTVGLVMSVGLIVAIRRYRATRTQIPDLPLEPQWTDFITLEDPVLNGARETRLPTRVTKVRVQNRASVVADHGSYWQNSDQFVAQVAMTLGELDDELALKRSGPKSSDEAAEQHLQHSYRRRSERIAALERVRGPIAIATAILLAVHVDQLKSVGQQVAGFFTWFPSIAVSWLPDVIESVIPITLARPDLIGAAVIVGLALLGYQITLGQWAAWGRADTQQQWAGKPPDPMSPAAIAFYGWAVLLVVLIAVVAIVGPTTVIQFIGDVYDDRNAIVRAWARQHEWSLIAAAAVLLVAWYRASRARRRVTAPLTTRTTDAQGTPRPGELIPRHILVLVFWGTALALIAELVFAILNPIALPPDVSIPIGIGVEVVGLIVASAFAPFATKVVGRFAVRVTQLIKTRPVWTGPTASPLDRAGVGGLLAIFVAAVIAIQPVPVAMLLAAITALVGSVPAWYLATNVSGRTLPLLGTSPAASSEFRIVGWAGTFAGLTLFAVESARLVMYLIENGIPR